MSEPRLILALAIPLIAGALHLFARFAGLGSRTPALVSVVLALELVLWMPPGIRDWTLAVIIGMIVFAGWDGEPSDSLVVGLVSMGLVLALGWLSGESTAIILALVSILGVAHIVRGGVHLARLRRAAALEPGLLPPDDVMIGGTVHASDPIDAPFAHKLPRAVWWAVCSAEGARATSGLLRVDSEAGTVLADLTHVDLEFTMERSLYHQTQDPAAIEKLFDRQFATRGKPVSTPRDGGDSDRARFDQRQNYNLHWLEPGDAITFVGKPEWERAPADVAGYRDAPVVPIFRGKDAFCSDKSVTRARSDAFFGVLMWSAWTPVCALLAVLQIVDLL